MADDCAAAWQDAWIEIATKWRRPPTSQLTSGGSGDRTGHVTSRQPNDDDFYL